MVQTRSEKGNVQANIENHLIWISRAIKSNADLIIFPELSITNYEPELAYELATDIADNIFNPFQDVSEKGKITIGVGMPIKVVDGVNISMLIFQPNRKRGLYSKRILHTDELPYFIGSNNQPFLNLRGKKVALGICYETLQHNHFLKAKELNAELFIASVSKPERGTDQAYTYFPALAKEFKIPILMANSVGNSDNFISNGLSAVWDKDGKLLGQLDDKNEGLIIYDTLSGKTLIDQVAIRRGRLSDLDQVFELYVDARKKLENNGIYQWIDSYPTRAIVQNDLSQGVLFVLTNDTIIIGAINISEEQEREYQTVDWKFDDSKVLVIHRLVIDPEYQRMGYAQSLMDFAEDYALKNEYTSIRLDAYSQNERVIGFYEKRGYLIRGDVRFPDREFVFHCMEREVWRKL